MSLAVVFLYRTQNKYSLISLAGALESSSDLDGIELFFPEDDAGLLKVISEISGSYSHIVVGVSLFTRQVPETKKLVNLLRKQFGKKILLVAGGPHPTGDPESAIQMGFNVAVIGEGEVTFPALVRHVLVGKDICEIPGIGFEAPDGTILINKRPPYVSLDLYQPFSTRYHKYGPLEITRGCPYGCFYCQTPRIFGGRVRHRSMDVILGYIETMKKRSFRDVRFTTPNFFSWGAERTGLVNVPALETLFTEIKRILPASL